MTLPTIPMPPRPIPGSRSRSWVYVMAAIDGSLKVGRTKSIWSRVSALSSAHGPMRLVAAFEMRGWGYSKHVEKAAHAALAAWRIGGEWFEPTERALAIIRTWILDPSWWRPIMARHLRRWRANVRIINKGLATRLTHDNSSASFEAAR